MCPVRGGESLQEQKATRGATEERAQRSQKLNSGADGLEEWLRQGLLQLNQWKGGPTWQAILYEQEQEKEVLRNNGESGRDERQGRLHPS